MIDPACRIAVDIAVDDHVIVQAEQKGVLGLARGRLGVIGTGIQPGAMLALVFDDAFALADVDQGEDTIAMDLGVPDCKSRTGCCAGFFLAGHAQAALMGKLRILQTAPPCA